MDISQCTSLEGCPETVYPTPIHVALVLVVGTRNLIEITLGNPFHPNRGLLRNELGEEVILSCRGGWPINCGQLETRAIFPNVHQCRKARFRSSDVGHMDKVVVPQKQDASAGANCRPLRKAPQSITTQKRCGELVHAIELRLLQAHVMAAGGGDCTGVDRNRAILQKGGRRTSLWRHQFVPSGKVLTVPNAGWIVLGIILRYKLVVTNGSIWSLFALSLLPFVWPRHGRIPCYDRPSFPSIVLINSSSFLSSRSRISNLNFIFPVDDLSIFIFLVDNSAAAL